MSSTSNTSSGIAGQQQQQMPGNNNNNGTAPVAPAGSTDVNSMTNSAQAQMMQAAMGTMNNNNNNNDGVDMASVLAKIQALEKEKSELKGALDNSQARLSKLQEGKRAEMEEVFNTTINKWLDQLSPKDPQAVATLRSGLEKLAKEGNESTVWEVMACASSNWMNNVNEKEQLLAQVNSYKEKEKQLQGSGLFQNENSRMTMMQQEAIPSMSRGGHMEPVPGDKRKADGISTGDLGSSGDIWNEFESMIMQRGGNAGADYSQGMPVDGMAHMQGLR